MTDEELEARSGKYNCDRIIRLSTGRFALFSPWSNREGIPLVVIGELEELGPLIHSTNQIDELTGPVELPEIDPDHATYAKPGEGKITNLVDLLGLGKSKEPIKRRV